MASISSGMLLAAFMDEILMLYFSAIVDNESGILVQYGNAELLKEAITKFVQDKDLRIKMGEAARERVSKLFSIKKHVELVQDLYDKIKG